VVVASVCLIALGAAGWRGTTDSSTLHGKGRGGHGFGRGCNSHQANIESPTARLTSMEHRGRGNGQGQGRGPAQFVSFSQAGQGCSSSSGGCQDGGTCSKSHSSSKGCGSTQGCSTTESGCQDQNACGDRQACGNGHTTCSSQSSCSTANRGCGEAGHGKTGGCSQTTASCGQSSRKGRSGCNASTGCDQTRFVSHRSGKGQGRGSQCGSQRSRSIASCGSAARHQGCNSQSNCGDGNKCEQGGSDCGKSRGCQTSPVSLTRGCSSGGNGCGSTSSDCGSGCSGGSHASTTCGSKKGGCDDSSNSSCGGCSAATGTCETQTGCNQDSEEADTLAAIGISEPHLPWWMNADSASDGCSRGKSQCGTKKAECGNGCDTTSKVEPDVAKSAD
jgi:hypothetical protein